MEIYIVMASYSWSGDEQPIFVSTNFEKAKDLAQRSARKSGWGCRIDVWKEDTSEPSGLYFITGETGEIRKIEEV